MGIHPADTPSVQSMPFHEIKDLGMLRLGRRRKLVQQLENLAPVPQGSACQFGDDERMDHDVAVLEQAGQPWAAHAEVLDPDRRVDEDHATRPVLRRLVGLSRGSEPPSFASLRALSLSINASSPMWMRAVFRETPVSFAALRSSSSWMFNVVLMSAFCCIIYAYVNSSAPSRILPL